MSHAENSVSKPLPLPSALSAPFWEALKQGDFQLQRCRSCGHYNHPPKIICPRCHGRELQWSAVARTGTVYSYTVVHRPPSAAFKADIPYAVGLVDIDGTDVRLLSSLVMPVTEAKVGMRVEVMFDRASEAITLFRFRPAGK